MNFKKNKGGGGVARFCLNNTFFLFGRLKKTINLLLIEFLWGKKGETHKSWAKRIL